MLIKTIEDNKNGRKWEIWKEEDGSYSYKYFESFNSIGWRETAQDCGYTKEAIEFEFEIKIA